MPKRVGWRDRGGFVILHTMSVADQLRSEQQQADAALTLQQRLELALSLGRRDAELYAAMHIIDLTAARAQIAKSRGLGRVLSRSAGG